MSTSRDGISNNNLVTHALFFPSPSQKKFYAKSVYRIADHQTPEKTVFSAAQVYLLMVIQTTESQVTGTPIDKSIRISSLILADEYSFKK